MANFDYRSYIDSNTIRKLVKTVILIVSIALAGNIIYILVTADAGLWINLAAIDPLFLTLGLALTFLPWLGQSTSIVVWSRVFGIRVSKRQALDAVLASDVAAAVTPTMLGGGYAKFALLISYGFSAPRATLVTFLGSLADAVFFAIALPAAVIWTRAWDNPHIRAIWSNIIDHRELIAIAIVALIIAYLFLRRISAAFDNVKSKEDGSLLSRIRHKISKFKSDFKAAVRFVGENGKLAFFYNVLLAGLGWCGRYGAISALALGFGIPVDPVLFFLLQWVVFTTMTLIPTPGAIGGAEVSFGIIYEGLVPPDMIPLITSVWRFATFYMTVGMASLIFAVFRFKDFGQSPAGNGD